MGMKNYVDPNLIIKKLISPFGLPGYQGYTGFGPGGPFFSGQGHGGQYDPYGYSDSYYPKYDYPKYDYPKYEHNKPHEYGGYQESYYPKPYNPQPYGPYKPQQAQDENQDSSE